MINITTETISIGGNKFLIKKDDLGTTVFYAYSWRKVLTDNDGDKYIYFNNKKRYFDVNRKAVDLHQ